MWWASMWTFLFREYAEKHQLQIDVSKSYVRLADSKKNLTTKKMKEFDEALKWIIKQDCEYGDFY